MTEMNEKEITNLLYSYAQYIDSGDFDSAANLFSNAQIKLDNESGPVTYKELLTLWKKSIITYSDGTPKTKHLITNPILNINITKGTATCCSYYTVMQSTDTLPLQAIASGRYYDEFVRIKGEWRYSFRDYSLRDAFGDMSHHSRNHTKPSSMLNSSNNGADQNEASGDFSPTKSRILAAAQKAFSTIGFAESGTRKIAEIANLSSGLVNRHFGSKATLFEVALNTALEKPLFPENRDQFGWFIAKRLENPGDYLGTHSMTLLAIGNEEARQIVIKVLQVKGIAPLAEWLGSPNAESRAREILALCAGFVLYNSQLTTSTVSDPHMVEWLANSLQAVVDQSPTLSTKQ